MRPLALFALATLPLPALAGQVTLWSQETWEPEEDVAGTDGWVNGYAADPWYGSQSGNSLIPVTDDNIDDDVSVGEVYGSGWAADNWLLRGDSFEQGGIKVSAGNLEEDAIGLVLNHNGSDSFYLLFHTSDAAPPPVLSVEGRVLVLVRVKDGVGVEVARKGAGRFSSQDLTLMRMNRNLDRINVFFGDTFVLGWDDPDPLPAGQAGVYAYDAGWPGGGDNSFPFFGDVIVYQFDRDDDTIVDDVDNCADLANADQADADDDGLGDACDETPNGSDTDSTTETDPGSDTDPATTDGGTTDASTDDVSDDDPLTDDVRVAACEGCANGAASGGVAAVALGALALVRRRRK